jgi:hypothetical protein
VVTLHQTIPAARDFAVCATAARVWFRQTCVAFLAVFRLNDAIPTMRIGARKPLARFTWLLADITNLDALAVGCTTIATFGIAIVT